MKTISIITLGCKVNQYESEAIAEALEKEGFCVCDPAQVCNLYIINTCTVTAESDRKSKQFIRRALSENPNAKIIVTGCLAATSGEVYVVLPYRCHAVGLTYEQDVFKGRIGQ